MPCFPVFEDNQGALQLSKNPVSNSNSKHIDVRHHFLRELVRQGDTIREVDSLQSRMRDFDSPAGRCLMSWKGGKRYALTSIGPDSW